MNLALALGALAAVASAKTFETMIPMSDGVKLHTKVVLATTEATPTVLVRTPYGVNSTQEFINVFRSEGFSVVAQEMRGTYESGGEFTVGAHPPLFLALAHAARGLGPGVARRR